MDYFEGQCTYCSKVFTCKETLEKHKLHVHIVKSAAHDCGECGKKHKTQGSSKDRNLKVKCQGEDYNPVIDLLLPLNIFKVSTFYPGGFLRNPRKC